MKKEVILLVVVTLVVGTLIGMIASKANESPAKVTQQPTSAPVVDFQQKIKVLKEVVGREPDNRNAWVQLGHNLFDSGQQMGAIEAYDKALELDGNDPDVLTDQGIMYRQVGWFDKAIANFIKANELNPNHPQSLFNLGLVYRDDLAEIEKAKKAWNQYLKISPTGQGADNVRTMLDHLDNGHGLQ
jgi:tetratricopeptide (TPR) repeat protein